ncbi:MAG: hypothetical protein M3170_01315 [Candidatus Dormibacteraeota bacterium]|jgi:hypothetical protein|nr:hypothetical protein [Candidatus Dormibacteraeota bacterium]
MGYRNFMPGRYRGVSVTHVDFALEEPRLRAHFLGREAYRRTRFIVVRQGAQVSVLAVIKASEEPLFSPIAAIEVLAGPGDCSYVVAPEVDTGVPTQVATAARRLAPGARCVVVQGRYEHVNFLLEPSPVLVNVLEVVPPEPPKLIDQLERVLAVAEDLPPVELVPVVVDLRDLAGRKPSDAYLFPCRGSGLTAGDAEVSYLDERPEPRSWVLVGCARSREIHGWFYGRDADGVEMCPRRLAAGLGGQVLTKCCLFEDRVERDGETTIVPWGATLVEVRQGLADLLRTAEPSWSPA